MADDKIHEQAVAQAAKSAETARKNRAEALADSQKQSEADTKAQLERTSSTQPTPTQAENDKAKLGVSDLSEFDDKEADGSPTEADRASKDAAAGNAPAAYNTRNLTPKK